MLSPAPPSSPSPAIAPAVARAGRADASDARRRRALLQLAARHGEVRVRLRSEDGVLLGASEVLELLDALNEHGLLRYGGLRQAGQAAEMVYLHA